MPRAAWVTRSPHSNGDWRIEPSTLSTERYVAILLKQELSELVEAYEVISAALVVLSVLQMLHVAEVELGPAWELPPSRLTIAARVAVSLSG